MRPPVALGSSPELSAFTMSLAPPVRLVQHVPLGVKFSNALSKLKAQSSKLKGRTSLLTRFSEKRRSSFEL